MTAKQETGATSRAVSALRKGMLSGRYVPGQRLVEADLSRELGVGRNSLREAFARLSSEGLVRIEPNRGASIRRLTRTEIADLYELSEVLEGLAARRAARCFDPRLHRIDLDSAVAALHEADGDVRRGVDAAAGFHKAVCRIAGGGRLGELIEQLHIQTFSFQLRNAGPGAVRGMGDESVAEHVGIAEAIVARDPTLAERRMRDHLRRGGKRVLALPDADFA